MSTTTGPPFGEAASLPGTVAPALPFTLRDLYARAAISGNSLAVELGHYLNIDETMFSPALIEYSQVQFTDDESDVHQRAVDAIHQVVASNSKAIFEHVRAPEPQGGVQEWWARMLGGAVNGPQSASDRAVTGESL